MKHLLLTSLFLGSLASLARGQVIDVPLIQDAPRVNVTHVDASMAFAPGHVSILGSDLKLVSEVRLNNVPVPVLHNDGTRLVLELAAQEPGFGDLRFFQGRRAIDRKIEFLPSIRGQWLPNSGKVRLALHPGDSGWYIVMYSYRRLGTPIAYPGTYYFQMLDLNTNHSGTLFSGQVAGDETLVFPAMRVPVIGSLSLYSNMHVQALCMGRESVCYSNALTLRPTL